MSTFTTWNGPQQYGPSMQNVTQLVDAYVNMAANVADMQANITRLQTQSATNEQLNTVNTAINNIATNYATNEQLDTVNATIASKVYTSDLEADYYNKAAIDTKTDDINVHIEEINSRISDTVNTQMLADNIDPLNARLVSEEQALSDLNSQFVYEDANIVGINQPLQVNKSISFSKYMFMNTGMWAPATNITGRVYKGVYILGEVSNLMFGSDLEPRHSRVFVKYLDSKPFDAIIDIVATRKNADITGELKIFINRESADDWTKMQFYLVKGTAPNDNTPRVWLAFYSADLDDDDRSFLHCNVAGINFVAGDDGTVPNGTVEVISTVSVPDTMVSGTVLAHVHIDELTVLHILGTVEIDTASIDSIETNNANIGNAIIDNVTANNTEISNANISNLVNRPALNNSVVATQHDIMVTLPIGAGIRWCYNSSDYIPDGFLPSGTEFNAEEYPVLHNIFPDDVLPIEDNTIFLAKYVM